MSSLAKYARGNFLSGIGVGSFAMVGRDPQPLPAIILDQKPRLFLAIEVGEWCQLACQHCIYRAVQPEKPALAAPQVRVGEKIERFFETENPTWVSFAGKEPTIFPEDLLRMAKIARAKSDLTILMTNGLRLQGELLGELEQNIGLFDISVDGSKYAHDWMRGEGTFDRTMARIEDVLKRGRVPVGIIATAVHSELDGKRQVQEIGRLGQYLRSRFGHNDNLSLSVSLYYDQPGHPMLLQEDDLVELVIKLGKSEMPSRILWTANYAHQWPLVARRLGLTDKIHHDHQTAIPFMWSGNICHILFNLTKSLLLGTRVSSRGNVYLGCNHLILGEEAVRFRIANLLSGDDDLAEVVARLTGGEEKFLRKVSFVDPRCEECSHFERCRGGDSLSGVYFGGTPSDPYCPLLQ